MTEITLRRFAPGDAAWIVERHQTLYTAEEGFDDTFGPLVAGILDDFITAHDPTRERGWIAADAQGRRLGCIFCVSLGAETAKLRLFLVTPEARGMGLGRRLLQECMTFARGAGYRDMTLWTHESHRAACALYADAGWDCIDSKPVRSFGLDLVEQTWTVRL